MARPNMQEEIREKVAVLSVKVDAVATDVSKLSKLPGQVQALYVTLMGNPETKDAGRIVVYDEASSVYLFIKKYWLLVGALYVFINQLGSLIKTFAPGLGQWIGKVVAGG